MELDRKYAKFYKIIFAIHHQIHYREKSWYHLIFIRAIPLQDANVNNLTQFHFDANNLT